MTVPAITQQINIKAASLPVTYEKARSALSECFKLDECKGWADKAKALASYAKQADDDELYKMARRIQGRAVRRVGELLQEFQTSEKGGRPEARNGGGGPPVSQRQAAKDSPPLARTTRTRMGAHHNSES